ncbi:MAG: hypothetical protein Q8O00_00040, partial [Holophaga sp.]|nr:hypothetical protein [Holophaga sp.]
ARHSEIRRNLIYLGSVKLFQGVHLSQDDAPHLVWPLCQGRSLATVIRVAEEQELPFGIDQSLFLIWVLTHHIAQLHHAKLPLGFLSPHRVWVGFDGLVELLDAPVITILEDLLPKVPGAMEAMAPYRQGPHREGIMHDAFQMGALLYKMLFHKPLPMDVPLDQTLEAARLQTPEGSEPLPTLIKDLLARLLGLNRPFADLEALEAHLENTMFGDETFNPTTFGLAFTMHTLFRKEVELERQALEAERLNPRLFAMLEPTVETPPEQLKSSRMPFIKRVGTYAAAFLVGAAALGAWKLPPRFRAPAEMTGQQPVPRPLQAAQIPATFSAPSESVPLANPLPEPLPTAAKPITPVPQSLPLPTPSIPVKLRVFVDEKGRVRQALVQEGATKGSDREAKAIELAMGRHLAPSHENGVAIRSWTHLTVQVK